MFRKSIRPPWSWTSTSWSGISPCGRLHQGPGLRLRPHTKTHKSPRIGRRQLDVGRGGPDRRQSLRGRSDARGRAGGPAGGVSHHRPRQAGAPDGVAAADARHGGARQHVRRAPALRRGASGPGRNRCAGGGGCRAGARGGFARLSRCSTSRSASRSCPHLTLEGITFYPGQIKDLDEPGLRALAQVADLVRVDPGRFPRGGHRSEGRQRRVHARRYSTPTKSQG